MTVCRCDGADRRGQSVAQRCQRGHREHRQRTGGQSAIDRPGQRTPDNGRGAGQHRGHGGDPHRRVVAAGHHGESDGGAAHRCDQEAGCDRRQQPHAGEHRPRDDHQRGGDQAAARGRRRCRGPRRGEGADRAEAGSHDRQENEGIGRDTDAGRCISAEAQHRQVEHRDRGQDVRPAGEVGVQRLDDQWEDRLSYEQRGVPGCGQAGQVLVTDGHRGGEGAHRAGVAGGREGGDLEQVDVPGRVAVEQDQQKAQRGEGLGRCGQATADGRQRYDERGHRADGQQRRPARDAELRPRHRGEDDRRDAE
jgi:hypothetical protein